MVTRSTSELWDGLLNSFENESPVLSNFRLKSKFGMGFFRFEKVGFDLKHLSAEVSFKEPTYFQFEHGAEDSSYFTLVFLRSRAKGAIHFTDKNPLHVGNAISQSQVANTNEIHYIASKMNEIQNFAIEGNQICRLDIIFINRNWLYEVLPEKLFETFDIPFVFQSRLSYLISSGNMIEVNQLFDILKEFHEGGLNGVKRLEKLGELYTFLSGFFETIHGLKFDKAGGNTSIPEKDIEAILELEKYLRSSVESETPDLVSLSERIGMCKTKMCKTFKDFYGAGIISYYNIIKLEHAKNILALEVTPVSEVCHRLSFSNQSYFTRWFKKLAGTSPRAYRRSKRSEAIRV